MNNTVIIKIFIVFDDYLKLILTSWPAVILILFVFILLRHKKAIDEFIKRRLKSAGPHGVDSYPPSTELESKIIPEAKKEVIGNNVALVSYKITSRLPGTIVFNLLKDWKVWFWIANHEPKKYRAYVKIKFISNNLEKVVTEGYYGGTQAWNLNAFSGIQAPGLHIPEEIKTLVRKGERVKIEIYCNIKDENDNLVEEKLPQTYVYDPQNNNWFLEP